MSLPTCETFGDCEFHKLSVEQKFNMLLIDDGGGCPALKVVTVGRDIIIESTTVTDDGSVTAGALAVTFTTSDDFTGTINGATRYANMSYTFDAKGGKTPAIAYTTTTGSITIDKII